jgi:hypothetical protein
MTMELFLASNMFLLLFSASMTLLLSDLKTVKYHNREGTAPSLVP